MVYVEVCYHCLCGKDSVEEFVFKSYIRSVLGNLPDEGPR